MIGTRVLPRVVFRPFYFGDDRKLAQILKTFHLRSVKEIKYVFDPFTNNTKSLRKVMTALNGKSVLKTSNARTKIEVRDEQCKPQIGVKFSDGHSLIFKTEILKSADIMEKLDTFCKAKDTAQPTADMALSKLSRKPRKKK